MALIAILTTWSAGNKLTATALNNEFSNIVDAVNGTDQVNLKTKYNAADLPTYQFINSHASGYALQAGDGTTNDLFGVKSTGVIESKVTTGTAPLIVASTTVVTNLNADLLDGKQGSAYINTTDSGQSIQVASGAINFTIASNTALSDAELRLKQAVTGDYWAMRYDTSADTLAFDHNDAATTLTGTYFYIWPFWNGSGIDAYLIGGHATCASTRIRLATSSSYIGVLSYTAATELLELKATGGSNPVFLQMDPTTPAVTVPAGTALDVAGEVQVNGNNSSTIQTLTDAASIAWNANNGSDAIVTLGGNRTLANITNPKVGAKYNLIVKQDGIGGRTLAFDTYYKFPGGTAPTITSTPGAIDVLTIFCESATVFYVVASQNFS